MMPCKEQINIALLGKTYFDNILHVKKIKLGETNEVQESVHQLGGGHNIMRANISGLNITYFECGQKYAFIINENEASQRTSFTYDGDTRNFKADNIHDNEWLHVAYLDDLEIDALAAIDFRGKISLDFCKSAPREPFMDIMEKSALIFDSRERKQLYRNINLSTPVILHDPLGCECIINQKVLYSLHIEVSEGIDVNGAGDVFAGFFIREYNKYGLEQATLKTCELTTDWLMGNQK